MSGNLRQRVLQSFKKLHQARKYIFQGDTVALNEARKKINEEYKKSKRVDDPNAISEMIKYSNEVEKELRTTIVQAKEVKPGVYEARITKDTMKLDNVPFNECANQQKT